MTGGAARFVLEQTLPPQCRSPVDAAGRRLGRPQPQLIIEERRKLRRDQVGRLRYRQAEELALSLSRRSQLNHGQVAWVCFV